MSERVRARPDHLAVWLDQGPWTLDPLRDDALAYAAVRPALSTTPPVVGEAIPLHTTDVSGPLLDVDADHRALAREVERFVDALVRLDREVAPGGAVEAPARGLPSIDAVDEEDVDELLDALVDSSWFTLPWTTYGLADALGSVVDEAVYQPRLVELMQRYVDEVEVYAHSPDAIADGRAGRAFLQWQQDASELVDLDEALRQAGRLDPATGAYRQGARAAGTLDDAGLFARFSRVSAPVSRVVVPVGLVLDGIAVMDEDASTGDRVAAGAGLASGGVAALTMAGVAFPPSIVVAAGVLGAASAAYGLWQLREPIADGAEWLWDHTGGAVWRGGVGLAEDIAGGLTSLATLGWR